MQGFFESKFLEIWKKSESDEKQVKKLIEQLQ